MQTLYMGSSKGSSSLAILSRDSGKEFLLRRAPLNGFCNGNALNPKALKGTLIRNPESEPLQGTLNRNPEKLSLKGIPEKDPGKAHP